MTDADADDDDDVEGHCKEHEDVMPEHDRAFTNGSGGVALPAPLGITCDAAEEGRNKVNASSEEDGDEAGSDHGAVAKVSWSAKTM